jgi:hypothetical protein
MAKLLWRMTQFIAADGTRCVSQEVCDNYNRQLADATYMRKSKRVTCLANVQSNTGIARKDVKNMKVYPIHDTNKKRLALVAEQMKELGSPTIRAVDMNGFLVAIEGSHRLESAYLSQIPVNLVIIRADDEVSFSTLDVCLEMIPDDSVGGVKPPQSVKAIDLGLAAYKCSPGPYEYDLETRLLSRPVP